MRRESYCEDVMTVRVLYHEEPEGWWAESPEIARWTVAGSSYAEVRELVVDGVSFALASEAEERGETFDESRFAEVVLEHFVQVPALAGGTADIT